jgi:hypothetical protein
MGMVWVRSIRSIRFTYDLYPTHTCEIRPTRPRYDLSTMFKIEAKSSPKIQIFKQFENLNFIPDRSPVLYFFQTFWLRPPRTNLDLPDPISIIPRPTPFSKISQVEVRTAQCECYITFNPAVLSTLETCLYPICHIHHPCMVHTVTPWMIYGGRKPKWRLITNVAAVGTKLPHPDNRYHTDIMWSTYKLMVWRPMPHNI